MLFSSVCCAGEIVSPSNCGSVTNSMMLGALGIRALHGQPKASAEPDVLYAEVAWGRPLRVTAGRGATSGGTGDDSSADLEGAFAIAFGSPAVRVHHHRPSGSTDCAAARR